MMNASPQVDAYIEKSAEFARPILRKIRELFHQACPQIEETLKWGCPSFEYKGIVGGMAAFKQHARYWFKQAVAQGWPSDKLTSVSQLPPDNELRSVIREAVKLNASGTRPPRPKAKKPVKVPSYFAAALRKNARARAAFDAFPPSHKREYVEWIVEAKQDETRARRMATAIEWIARGKSRNWKYEKR